MPALPQSIEDRLRRIEEALRVLAGRANIRPALDEILSGRVLIGEGGSLLVLSPDEDVVLAVGEYTDGTYGSYLGRGDGTGVGIVIGPSGTGGGQMLRLYARGSAVPIVMDDIAVDGFLGRPWIPYTLPVPLGTAEWPHTGATSWATVARSFASRQHANIQVFGSAYAPAGSAGEMRLLVNGAQIGPTVSVPDNGFGQLDWAGPLPVATAWGGLLMFEVQCQRTSGSGDIYAAFEWLQGVNSV